VTGKVTCTSPPLLAKLPCLTSHTHDAHMAILRAVRGHAHHPSLAIYTILSWVLAGIS
jgi:hypothetical protein